MILYHRTSETAARQIVESGGFVSKYRYEEVWFTNRKTGQADGYGEAWVKVNIPADLVSLDDEFPDGELHYSIPAREILAEYVLSYGKA